MASLEGVFACLQESSMLVLCRRAFSDDQVRNIVLECFWSKERSLKSEPEELEKKKFLCRRSEAPFIDGGEAAWRRGCMEKRPHGDKSLGNDGMLTCHRVWGYHL